MSSLQPFILPRRRDLLALSALLALVLVFFWKLALTNLIIARGDIFTYFTPYRDFAAQALREGRIPLWNPYLFMGAPFLANSQAGVFYPLNWLLAWLDTARAIDWTIVLHVFIAASGVYVFARSRLSLSIGAAFFAAMSFGLGGYLGTQIEHVNQLQGLAWLGWLFLAYEQVVGSDTRSMMQDAGSRLRDARLLMSRPAFRIGSLSLLIAFQLLAGHTQTVFITLVGLGVYAAYPTMEMLFVRRPFASCILHLASRLWPLALASIFAIALSAVQLLPTLELTRESARSGGLPTNLAVSFSLDPRLIGRALLPDYAGAMPEGGELTAFFSVTALVLATIGVIMSIGRSVNRSIRRALVVVAGLGLLLALGGYNPIYYLLLKVPGFDLFRAPARWIVLLVFAGSSLAGVGLDAVRESFNRRWLIAPLLIHAALLASTFVSAGLIPAGASGPLGSPDTSSLLLWLAAAAVVGAYALLVTRHSSSRSIPVGFIILLAALELFFATRALPYNSRATAPDALTNLRLAITALQVGAQSHTPPDRFLSLSKIQFDPGDTAELKSIYGDQLSDKAFYDLIVATKAKEVVAPNLSMFYRLPSVDGYDGGVLPLRNYITFQRLLLDPSLIQTDGRLREQLKSIPDARWLNVMNARYIVTDKVGDQWYDGVLYDLQFTTRLASGTSAATDQLPAFKGDALGVVYATAADAAGGVDAGILARIEITFDDGSIQTRPLVDQPLEVKDGLSATRVAWVERRGVKAIRVTGAGGVTVRGLALIDQASGAFQSFVLAPQGRFRVAYSGDVKIYENVDALPRAFGVSSTHTVATDDEAIAYMQRAEFDPAGEVVIGDQGSGIGDQAVLPDHLVIPSSCHLVTYKPEHVVIEANIDQDAYLVLTDAYYPGWIATVDGQPTSIERADVLFRAVKVPAGAHRIEFRYEPLSFAIGAAISIGAWVLLIGLTVVNGLRSRRRVL